MGFETQTDIQAQALPILLGKDTDFLGLATTGTGKTAAFGIPLLERIDPKDRSVQALVLCPTRELALQVTGQLLLLGKYMGIRALAVYGGTGYPEQLRGLRAGAQIVVGTPGRVCDHLDRKALQLHNLKTLVLDEADEMISMGFKEDLTKILDAAPPGQSNTWLFSATMSREVRHVADDYLKEPEFVQINRTEMLASGVEQLYYVTSEANKPEVLCKLIDAADDFYGIIFCQTKSLVADLSDYLVERKYSVDCLHGDKDQKARERTMQAFRDHRVNILICTDVASRGLDVKDISHVINYSIPKELDSYVHRIGRTARSGKSGFAMSLVTPYQRGLVTRVERATKSKMTEGKIPSRKDVAGKKVSAQLARFLSEKNGQRAMDLLGDDWKTAFADMPREEIAGRFLALMRPELFEEREPEADSRRIHVAPDRKPPPVVLPGRARVSVMSNEPAPNLILPKPRSMAAPAPVVLPKKIAEKAKEKAKEPIVEEVQFEAESDFESDVESVLESDLEAAPVAPLPNESKRHVPLTLDVVTKSATRWTPERKKARKGSVVGSKDIVGKPELARPVRAPAGAPPWGKKPFRSEGGFKTGGFKKPFAPSTGGGGGKPFGKFGGGPRKPGAPTFGHKFSGAGASSGGKFKSQSRPG